MKRFVYCTLLLLSSLVVGAQLKIGLVAGFNFPYQTVSASSSTGSYHRTNDMLVSFHAGAAGNVSLSPKLTFQAGLQVSGKGSNSTYEVSPNVEVVQKEKLLYAELPLVFLYKIPVNKSDFLIGGGAAIAYGISGKGTNDLLIGSVNPFANNNHRFDAGIVFRAGITIDKWQISTDYNLGAKNIYKAVPEVTIKNKTLILSVAYFFYQHK